jgi:hypothetical protein
MQVSKKGRRVVMEISIWWEPKHNAIHVTSKESKTFAVAIRKDPTMKTGHPYLFRELSKCLRAMGAEAP